MNRRHLIASALPFALAARAAAAEALGGKTNPATPAASPGDLDAVAKAFIDSGYGVGLSVAAIRDERLQFAKGYGLANLENATPVTGESVFRAGSITKQFVAAAIMKLVESGRLNLDERVSKFVPEMASTGPITVRMLLHQTSGLHNYSGRDFAQQQKIDRTPKEMLDYILAQPKLIDFAPNERFEYSNSNYFVLGVIIERIEGRPLESALDDLIRAAGLKQTAVDHDTDVVPHRADGYALLDGQAGRFARADYLSMHNAGGAGVLRSTPEDLARWHQALFGGRIVKQTSFQQMLETATLNDGRPALRDDAPIAQGKPAYGFGLEVGLFDEQQAIGHGGSVPGYTSYVVTFPAQQLSVAIMMNINPNREMPFTAILRKILGTRPGGG